MLSTLIALFLLQSSPVPKPAPSRTEADCVEACVRKAQPCYAKCETRLSRCLKAAPAKCAKTTKDAAALKACEDDAKRECKDEKEINCDPQCSITVLQCMKACEAK